MPPRWAKQERRRLAAALRVLREESWDDFEDVANEHAVAFASLFLEPNHAIQQRSAAALADDVEDRLAELMQ